MSCCRFGFARRIITTAHEVAERENWSGIIGLDAIQYVKSLYEKFSYKSAFETSVYEGTVSMTSANQVGFGIVVREVLYSLVVATLCLPLYCSLSNLTKFINLFQQIHNKSNHTAQFEL